jgi:hypothetical protein
MNHLKNFDLFNEGFLDFFKSKEPKRLSFSEEEMRYITGELSDLISNFDAQHSKGDVTTKHMIAKKAKKEYSIIDLYCREYYSRSERLHLQCFKTRFYDNGEFVTRYHFGGDIVSDKSIDTIENFVSRLKKIIITWKIHIIMLSPSGTKYHIETIMKLVDEYNVIRDGKIIEFRLREMIDEISDHNVRKVTNNSRMKPFKKYDDEHNRIIKRLKEMNVEFL